MATAPGRSLALIRRLWLTAGLCAVFGLLADTVFLWAHYGFTPYTLLFSLVCVLLMLWRYRSPSSREALASDWAVMVIPTMATVLSIRAAKPYLFGSWLGPYIYAGVVPCGAAILSVAALTPEHAPLARNKSRTLIALSAVTAVAACGLQWLFTWFENGFVLLFLGFALLSVVGEFVQRSSTRTQVYYEILVFFLIVEFFDRSPLTERFGIFIGTGFPIVVACLIAAGWYAWIDRCLSDDTGADDRADQKAHGKARLATEAEAQAAARSGGPRSASIHTQDF